MEKLTYTKNSDYLIPDLEMDGQDEIEEMPWASTGCCARRS